MIKNENTFTDECGAVYSADKKTLIKCPNVERYRVAEGATHLAPFAFCDCSFLQEIELPWTMDEDVDYFKDDITDEEYDEKYMMTSVLTQDVDKLNKRQRKEYDKSWHELFDGHKFIIPFTAEIIQWAHPYSEEYLETHCSLQALEDSIIDEFGVRYSKDGKRVLCTTSDFVDVKEYPVKPGVVTIADMAFHRFPDSSGRYHPLIVRLPDSVEKIGYDAFPLFRRDGNDFIFNHEQANDPLFWAEYLGESENPECCIELK